MRPSLNTVKLVAIRALSMAIRLRSKLVDRLLLLFSPFIRPSHDNPSSGRKRRMLATFFLYTNYQRPYLFHLDNSIKALDANIEVRSFDIREVPKKIRRVTLMAHNHGVGFHACPFRTEDFPGTLHHVLIQHGLTAGRYDELGSFSYGSGRLLGKHRKRLYDFILIPSPWDRELIHIETPEYTDRVLMAGDWRADAILCAARNPIGNRIFLGILEGVPVVGIASSHGVHSTLRQFGNQLFDTIRTFQKDVIFMIFFHEYERVAQKDLFESVSLYCDTHKNVLIVPDEKFDASLAACDLLISDYGSTSLYFSLLGRPLVFLPFDESFMLPDFPTMILRQQVQTSSSLADSVLFIEEVVRAQNDNHLLRPPEWFIQRLYPHGINYPEFSQKALQTIFSSSYAN